MRGEFNVTVALGAAMCIFVTISEKRGIVYTEHMLAVAAAMMEAKGSATWVSPAPDTAALCAFWEPVKPLM